MRVVSNRRKESKRTKENRTARDPPLEREAPPSLEQREQTENKKCLPDLVVSSEPDPVRDGLVRLLGNSQGALGAEALVRRLHAGRRKERNAQKLEDMENRPSADLIVKNQLSTAENKATHHMAQNANR